MIQLDVSNLPAPTQYANPIHLYTQPSEVCKGFYCPHYASGRALGEIDVYVRCTYDTLKCGRSCMSERFELRLERETLQRIDAWRSKREVPASRSEAVRRLLEIGLGERGEAFELMRVQVLLAARQGFVGGPHWQAYAFAWARGVFPLLHESVNLHEPFSGGFRIQSDRVRSLLTYLDRRLAGAVLTFFELQEEYVSRHAWLRADLINACRYLRLCKRFDTAFWDRLTQAGGKSPFAAGSILIPFEAEEIAVF